MSVGESLKTCKPFLEAAEAKGFDVMNDETDKWQSTGNSTDAGGAAAEAFGTLAVVFAVAFTVAVFYLFALESQARLITWVSVCMWPVLVFLAGLYEFGMGSTGHDERCFAGDCHMGGMICMAMSLPVALMIFCMRAQVDLTAELLRMSASCFKENLTLVVTTGLTNFISSICFITPLWIMLVINSMPEDASLIIAGCPGCNFAASDPSPDNGTDLYNWNEGLSQFASCPGVTSEPPKNAFLILLFFMGIWVQMLAMELRVANVSGAVGLHYFEQDTGGSNRSVQSMKWALTSNFGSLCYCSFVLTVVKIIDYMIQTMLQQSRRGNDNIALKIVMEIVACLWRCLEVWIQFLTKMAVIALSITGDGFCTSAKSSSAMLIRHNLDGFFIDQFAGFTLSLFSMTVSAAFGYLTYLMLEASRSDMSVVLGAVGFVVAFVALMAISGILLVVCNTHYMCYIMDLDHSFAPSNNTQKIHELYKRAIDRRIGEMRKNPKVWAVTGPGKREAAAQAGQSPARSI